MTVYVMKSTMGWSTAPCPGCGRCPGPGSTRVTVAGEWLPWHQSCWNLKQSEDLL